MKKVMLLGMAMLSACQTATPVYRAASHPNSAGFFTAQADGGRYTVAYTGDKGMPAAQVAEYALLRAADLTIESGHEWFAVIEGTNRRVEVGDINSIQGRSGSVLTSESATAGAGGGGDKSSAGPGVSDGAVPGGPSTGGFGGGDVPYQVLERWVPPAVHRASILIQMGSGNQASFEGLEKEPEIYSAKAVAKQIREKMAR